MSHSFLHRLDHGFDELALGVGQTVLVVELAVDLGNRPQPVDVRRRGEVSLKDIIVLLLYIMNVTLVLLGPPSSQKESICLSTWNLYEVLTPLSLS